MTVVLVIWHLLWLFAGAWQLGSWGIEIACWLERRVHRLAARRRRERVLPRAHARRLPR